MPRRAFNLASSNLISVRTKAIAAVVAASCSMGVAAAAESVITLDQGWSPKLRDEFYYTPQGSRLIPYDWFMALERADDTTPFASRASLSRYDWSWPLDKSPLNPDDLPVGFVKDPASTELGQHLGLTCAACHTSNLAYKGIIIRIDGAPSLADVTEFWTDMNSAVQATLPFVNKDRFQRFATKVLGSSANPQTIEALGGKITAYATELAGVVRQRQPSLTAGRGRVDALTQIINSLSTGDLREPNNLREPIAPVSYPFLWLAPKLDFVQWDPVASSPISRNAGEVLGVFGDVNFVYPPRDLFKSSVLYKNLGEIEDWLWDLKPPVWPEPVLGKINRDLAAKGKALFDHDCRGCHNMQPFEMTSPVDSIGGHTFIKIKPIDVKDVGVDPTYIQSLVTRTALTDQLAPVLFGFKPVVSGAEYFFLTVGATVGRGLNDAGFTPQEQLKLDGFRKYPPHSPNNPTDEPKSWAPSSATALKAGPLYGVWATGPFLHNGSVPNIAELLSPPEKRSKVFWVGSHEFDPQKLGFKSGEDELSSAERTKLFLYDTRLSGNGNGGHAYPPMPYSDEDRAAVLEYLKAAKLDEK